jgi:hypothetical protein
VHVLLEQVQGWLNIHKYDVGVDQLDPVQEGLAANFVLSALEQRYDTSTWVDEVTTPPMIVQIISMLVASYTLRKAVSEDDGVANYAGWLENRAKVLVEGLINGGLDLPGVDPDPTAPASSSVGFFPTQEATDLWEDDPHDPEGAARHFDSQMVF